MGAAPLEGGGLTWLLACCLVWSVDAGDCVRAPSRTFLAVTRIAYRAPGAPNVYPADAALNLPAEKHSHGLRRHAAIESARGWLAARGVG